MPELPEVETIVRALAPRITGADILDVRATSHAKWATAARATGGRITDVRRRGKHIIIDLEGPQSLDVHLGMSGVVALLEHAPELPLPEPVRHERLLLLTGSSSGLALVRLTDMRGFGHAMLSTRSADGALDLASHAAMGPEPLGDWPAEAFVDLARGRRAPIKALLLDQSVVAGVGNYLADEALFAARVHPATPANELSDHKLHTLHAAVRDVIASSLAQGGASLRNYRQLDGERGSTQEQLLAYGRVDLPCQRCGTPMRKLVVAGRGSTFCPRCQRQR